MSIVKIQGVKKLRETIDYIKQDTKTDEELISTFDCDKDFIVEDFYSLYDERKRKLRKDTNNKAKMIIQSFDFRDNITKEQAHEIGVKLANEYLKGNHQYIVATHTDTDFFHNHIIFNEVRSDNLLMFDTSRRNTIDNLRLENDKLSREYNLHIPKEKTHEDKIHYISQRERKARGKGTSFKEKIEYTIDEVIENSDSYENFIERMKLVGFKSKEGRHLAFLNNDSNYFMRSKTLGMNYTKNSIKYRIKNKDFKIHKFKYTVETKKIDMSQEKFKDNYGLRKWATKKNIAHLQEISHLVFNEKKTLEEIEEIQKNEDEFYKDIEKSLQNSDSILYDLENKSSAFQDYKDSASMIAEYKKADDKTLFKKYNYKEFKKYDMAKKNIYLLRRDYDINNIDDLFSYKEQTEKKRNKIFSKYTKVEKEKEQEKVKEREQEKSKKHKIIR